MQTVCSTAAKTSDARRMNCATQPISDSPTPAIAGLSESCLLYKSYSVSKRKGGGVFLTVGENKIKKKEEKERKEEKGETPIP